MRKVTTMMERGNTCPQKSEEGGFPERGCCHRVKCCGEAQMWAEEREPLHPALGGPADWRSTFAKRWAGGMEPQMDCGMKGRDDKEASARDHRSKVAQPWEPPGLTLGGAIPSECPSIQSQGHIALPIPHLCWPGTSSRSLSRETT